MAPGGVVLFVAMLGGAAALATVKPTNADAICGIICVDSVNECGERYGGCYDPCFDPAPEAPPCLAAPYTNIWYPTPPPTPITPSTDGEDEDCSKIIVCVDGVNECGIPFGACIPDCKPWNITIPSCPPETDEPVEVVLWQAAEDPVPEEPVPEEPVPEDPLIGEPIPEEIVPWIPSGPKGWFD